MTPHQTPQTVEPVLAAANELALPVRVRAEVCRLLRCWAGRLAADADQPDPLLPGRLGEEPEAQAAPLLEGLLDGFRLYRQDAWLQYVTSPATVWGQWVGGELDIPAYEVVKVAFSGARLRLRRETPFGPDDVLRFLAGFADAEEAGKLLDKKGALLRGVVVDVVCAAVRQAGPTDATDGPLELLHRYHRGEQFRAGALRRLAVLRQPPPPGLQACLGQLLSPPVHAEGCLTGIYEVRLFRHAADLAAPYVPRQRFEAAHAAIEALREAVKPQPACTGTLLEVCARLQELGTFAGELQPVLAGPAAGPHRDWVRHLLENFLRLGEVAGYVLAQPEATPADAAEPVGAAAPPAEDAGRSARVAPPPVRAARELSPEDTAVAELAATEPAAKAFQAICSLAEELLEAVKDCWADAEEALKGLHYPGNRFKQKLARAVQAPAAERSRQLGEAARQLADEFVNKIRRLDALLPGTATQALPFKGPDGLSAQEREGLGRQLKALRDRLFAFMRTHGGYDEYPVRVGESVRKHGPALDDVSYVTDARLRADEIVQILEPGYVRRRADGKQELIRSPRVLVAR